MYGEVVASVAKNTAIMLTQQVITWASTFLLMLFLPRYLGPVEYGKLYLVSSITAIFSVFVAYGGTYLVAKEVSRSRERTAQILVDAVAFRFVFAIVSFAAMLVFSFVVGYPKPVRVLLTVYGLSLLWQGGTTVLYACYQGHELMKYTSAGAITERVLISTICIVALVMGASTAVIVLIFVIGFLSNFLILAAFRQKIVTRLPGIDVKDVIRQIKEGAPYLLFVVFGIIYYHVDSIMLSRMAPEAVLGWYGGAYRLFESLNFFPFIFSAAIFPILSRLWRNEMDTHKRTAQKSLEFMIIVGVPLSVAVIVFADKIIEIFYGLSDYRPSVLLLQVLSAGLVLLYVDMALGTTLLASDRQAKLSVVSLCAIPVNIILNYILIPYYQAREGNGGIGAAVATALTELGIMVAYLKLVPRGILKGFRGNLVIKNILAGIFMAAFLWLTSLVGVPWAVRAFVSPLVYLGSLVLMRTFEPAEERFIQGLLRARGLKDLKELLRPDRSGFAGG